ncbi:MAG: ribonuclease P protein component, partial [Deltaproteobacteria bacterium]|nr:ribonuclease P protein component [Deltaproteobacteria bacterium]
MRKRAEFLRVQGRGRKVQTNAFVGLFASGREGFARLGITTSKRVGCAVVRNRTRRIVREAFRRGVLEVPQGLDLVVIAKRSAAELSGGQLVSDLRALSRRLRLAV